MIVADRDDFIRTAFLQGWAVADLAISFGITPRRVRQIVAPLRGQEPVMGRPRLPVHGEDRKFYRYLRRNIGAAKARAHFGIAA